jgi:hypothetical protein
LEKYPAFLLLCLFVGIFGGKTELLRIKIPKIRLKTLKENNRHLSPLLSFTYINLLNLHHSIALSIFPLV